MCRGEYLSDMFFFPHYFEMYRGEYLSDMFFFALYFVITSFQARKPLKMVWSCFSRSSDLTNTITPSTMHNEEELIRHAEKGKTLANKKVASTIRAAESK